jgi:hypothetical protein
MYGGEELCMQFFVGKPRGKRPLGKPRHRWADNIRMDFEEIQWKEVDCCGLFLANVVKKLRHLKFHRVFKYHIQIDWVCVRRIHADSIPCTLLQ